MNIACMVLGILLGLVIVIAGMFILWAVFADH